jgi:transposase
MKYLAMDRPPAPVTGELVILPAPPERRVKRSRRSWTVEQKLAIVREAQEAGDPVAVVARRHDMNANHLFMWIEQALQGTLGGRRSKPEPQAEPMDFIDLGVIGQGPPTPEAEPVSVARPSSGGAMEITLPSGVRIRVSPPVDPDALRQVILAAKAAS